MGKRVPWPLPLIEEFCQESIPIFFYFVTVHRFKFVLDHSKFEPKKRESQLKAAISVNSELILLYWDIGKEILGRQDKEGWGAKIIERLAMDLKNEFPGMKGFSPRNLKYMRQLALLFPDFEFVQQAVAQIPWGHTVRLMELVKEEKQREWYIHKIVEHGWSRNILVHQIESDLYHRQGKGVSYFSRTRPHLIIISLRCLRGIVDNIGWLNLTFPSPA